MTWHGASLDPKGYNKGRTKAPTKGGGSWVCMAEGLGR